MSHLPVYLRERIEELRSRVTLMKTTLINLKQSCWSTYHDCCTDHVCPPFLFPVSTFLRLEASLERIYNFIEQLNPDGKIRNLAPWLSLLHTDSRIILKEILRLQNVVNQRLCGLGAMKTVEFKPYSQFEFGTISKSYCAVDALTVDLVKRILGSSWISENKYIPISLFDYSGYAINAFSFIISIPYYDSFRCRFWAALAHEVAHIFVNYYGVKLNPFRSIMKTAEKDLMAQYTSSLKLTKTEKKKVEPYCALQIAELASDIISVYVCPFAFLTASTIIKIPLELKSGALIENLKYVRHPPTDSRIEAMKTVLEKMKHLSSLEILERNVRCISNFFLSKNMHMLSTKSFDFIVDYNELARGYARKILRILPRFNVVPFTPIEMKFVREAITDLKGNGLSPLQLITLAWIKRLNVTKSNGHYLMKDYFKVRKNEPKFFDQIVHQMFKYYEQQIVPSIKGEEYYDVCLDLN